MAGSLNKVTLIGNIGQKPETRTMGDGKELITFSLATSESWKDKATGERKEKTEWHRVVVFNEGLVRVVKNYIDKGSKVYIEGALQTRSWVADNGDKKYSTEVVLQGYACNLVMLDKRGGDNSGGSSYGGAGGSASGGSDYGASNRSGSGGGSSNAGGASSADINQELDDDVPF